MVQFILVFFLFYSRARADFLGFSNDGNIASEIPNIVEKVGQLKVEVGPNFEEQLNGLIKSLESRLDEEKLICAGEATDSKGKTISEKHRQLCFRQLKTRYLDAMDIVFEIKTKYLKQVHQQQLDRMSEIKNNLKKQLEKSF